MASTENEVLDPSAAVEKLNNIAEGRALNRRHFLAAIGMTGAAAGAGLMSGCSVNNTTVPTTLTTAQTNVLNFALNLEYLEATFYSYLTQGKDIPSNLTGGGVAPAGTSGITGLSFSQQITDLLNEIYFDEVNHVTYLQSLLGTLAVNRPAISFTAVTSSNALSVARLFEDVGITAYVGAVTALSSSNLTFAAQILGVESFHSGALRLISIQNPGSAPYLGAGDGLDVPTYDPGTAALAAAGPTAKGGFYPTYGGAVAPTNTVSGTAYARSTSQVLAIVYGAPGSPAASGTSSGGFFPSGVNGTIKTV